jgi:dTDP-4-amino-4,6-dideoxygalactose transaminase
MDQVLEIARRHNLKVIEDCSHAHGALWKGRPVGSLGDIGVFSLQGAKPIAAGEGGVAVTDSAQLLDRMLAYGHQGRRVSGTLELAEPSAFFPVTGFGRKCRAHPLGIALAEVDLKWLRRRNALLRGCWDAVAQAVRSSHIVTMQTPSASACMGGYFLGGAVRIISPKVAADHVCKVLEKSGVAIARGVQKPNHVLPHLYDRAYRTAMLRGEAGAAAGGTPSLPHTEEAVRNVILLPLEQFVHGKRRRALVRALALLDKEA